MFSVITNIYNKKTKGPTWMELLTATGKLKKIFFFTNIDVWCVHHGWHGMHWYDIQVLATRQHDSIHILHCGNDPCLEVSEVTWQCWDEYLCVFCTKCTLHSNHRVTHVIFQHTKGLLTWSGHFLATYTRIA